MISMRYARWVNDKSHKHRLAISECIMMPCKEHGNQFSRCWMNHNIFPCQIRQLMINGKMSP